MYICFTVTVQKTKNKYEVKGPLTTMYMNIRRTVLF